MAKKIFILFILLSCFLFAEEVNVKLSQSKVGLNESFSVVFSLKGSLKEPPDFSPLKTEFTILSTSQGTSATYINGRMSQESNWTLELVPRHEGQLILPSIQFGQSKTEPKTIEVTAPRLDKNDETLFLEVEIYPEDKVYAQTPLTYSIRLYRSVNLAQGSLTEVKVNDPDALIERLGEDTEYEHFHQNGNRYLVLERRYLVTPQQIGELLFSPIVFEGKIITGGNSFFNTQTQYKRINSDPMKADVKPIPPPFNTHNWFPAYDVKLKEEWSSDPNNVKIGEPITWTLTFTAEGCMGSQIPDISLNIPAELKHYLDKPQIENQKKDDELTGTKIIKVALIPTKSGTIPLPDVKVKWWNLDEDQLRETHLPGTVLQVLPGEIAMNNPPIDSSSSNLDDAKNVQPEVPEHIESPAIPIWAWLLIGLNGFWIIGGLIYLLKKVNFKSTKHDSSVNLKEQLKKACLANEPKLTEIALLAWAIQLYPEIKPLNLIEIKKYVPETLQGHIEDLYQALYGQKSSWEGESLWKVFTTFKPKKKTSSKTNDKELLRKLYN